MPVLNHHIVATRDKEATARYFTEILGLDDAVRLGEFAVLRVSADTTLDFIDADGDFDRLPRIRLGRGTQPGTRSLRAWRAETTLLILNPDSPA